MKLHIVGAEQRSAEVLTCLLASVFLSFIAPTPAVREDPDEGGLPFFYSLLKRFNYN